MKMRKSMRLPMMRFVLLIIAALYAGTIHAGYTATPDFKVNGVYYQINGDSATVSVTFMGTLSIVGSSHGLYSGDVTIPETVEHEGKTYTVTGIGMYAFYFCYVSSVNLPKTIKSIGLEAFRGCKLLSSLNVPSGVSEIGESAFAESGILSMTIPDGFEKLPRFLFRGSQLQEVSLPSSLKIIDQDAFFDCKLTRIYIPDGVEEIGQCAFWHVPLTLITWPKALKKIGPGAFEGTTLTSITLPSGVESIGHSAFQESKLEDISIPANVKSIEEETFSGCSELKSVLIEDTQIETIGKRAFFNCPSLMQISLPKSLQSIGEEAFSVCNILESVNISEDSQLKSIARYAFYGSSKMQSIYIPASIEEIGNYAFSGLKSLKAVFAESNHLKTIGYSAFYETSVEAFYMGEDAESIGEYAFYMCTSLKKAGLTNCIERIGERAFWGCSALEEITIPVNLVSIEHGTFYGCSMANTLEFPSDSKLRRIGDYAFYSTQNIETLEFPEALDSIGSMAFYGCSSLQKVAFGQRVRIIGSSAFSACNNIGQVDIGDLANWCSIDFKNSESNPLQYTQKIIANGKDLRELTIPNGVKSIGSYAFYKCQRIENLSIPNSVESIGTGSFTSCSGLYDVTLPDGITSIGASAFSKCSNLISIKLPSSLANIPSSMLADCIKLTEVVMPETLESIDARAFYDCRELTQIDLPKSLKTIGMEAFQGCIGLKGVYIHDIAAWCNIKMYSYDAGGNFAPSVRESTSPLLYNGNLYLDGELVTDLVIPEGVKKIEPYAFMRATCITSVQIPNTVDSIGTQAFIFCGNLSKIVIPGSVKYIGDNAFGHITWNVADKTLKLYIENLEVWLQNNHGRGFAWAGNNIVRPFIELYVNNERVLDVVVPKSISELNDCDLGWMKLNSVTLHNNIDCFCGEPFNYSEIKYIYSQSKYSPVLYKDSNKANTITYVWQEGLQKRTPLTAIYVPKGSANSYKARWSDHSEIIIEANPEMTGEQSAESIAEMKRACEGVYGANTYIDLTGAILDESVTAETLKAGDGDGNVLYYLPTGTTGITGDNIIIDGVANSVTLSYGKPICIPKEFTASIVKFAYDMKSGESHTLCLPFDLTLPEGMKAFSLRNKNGKGDLVFMESENVKAYTPYIVVSDENITSLDATNVTMKETPEEMDDAGIPGFEFRGSITGISQYEAANNGIYALKKDYKWVSANGNDSPTGIAACSAYLIPSAENAKAVITCILHSADDPLPAGDVNGDYSVDIVDIVSIINYIMAPPSDVFDPVAADLNGDGEIDIFDVMKVANLVMKQNEVARNEARAIGDTEDKITIKDFSISAGETKEVSIELENQTVCAGLQFDLFLPEHISIMEYSTDNTRVPEGATVQMKKQADDSYRFLVAATDLKTIKGTNGSIITIKVSASTELGSGSLTGYFKNVKLSNAEGDGLTYQEMSYPITVLEPSTVTAKSYERVYGDANPEFAFEIEGGELDGAPEITCEATATSPVGTYDIIISNGSVTNFKVTYVNGTLTIKKAPLTITVKDYTIKQGEALPTFEVTYEGFKNEETSEVLTKQPTITTTATSESEPGEYDITVIGAEADNYDVSYVNGKLTIEVPPIILGDANSDGKVDALDIEDIANHIMGRETSTGKFDEEAADMNGDKVINATDIVKLVDKLADKQ